MFTQYELELLELAIIKEIDVCEKYIAKGQNAGWHTSRRKTLQSALTKLENTNG